MVRPVPAKHSWRRRWRAGESVNWWANRGKYITSYLKALYGDHATKDNDFGYAWLPKLDEGMNAVQLARVLAGNLASVPYVEGINNHMGSLLTQQKSMMDLFMHALAKRGRLFFIDSRTTSASVALVEARENGIASTSRDVFLDDDRSPALINHQLDLLVRKAQRKGYALAIGHPYPETLQVLETRLPQLQARGIQMVKASVYIADKYQKRFLWQASLSPSPRVVKN